MEVICGGSPVLGWEPYVDDDWEVHEVPGSHDSMIGERMCTFWPRRSLRVCGPHNSELIAECGLSEPGSMRVLRIRILEQIC